MVISGLFVAITISSILACTLTWALMRYMVFGSSPSITTYSVTFPYTPTLSVPGRGLTYMDTPMPAVYYFPTESPINVTVASRLNIRIIGQSC